MQIDKQQPMRECEIQIVDYINAGNIASLDDVNNAVNVEKERAIAREDELEAEIKTGGDVKQALDAEIERATTRENELESAINTNEQAISNEITRATNKENDLNSAISAETSRATAKENELENSINSNEQAISNEVTRATSKESELENSIFTNKQLISIETERATNKENELNTKFDDYAPLNSPTLIGTPSAPTAEKGTSSTQVATTEFVSTAISEVTPDIADGSITTAKLANSAVTSDKIKNNEVMADKLYRSSSYNDNWAIIQSSNQIRNTVVTTAKLSSDLQTLVSFIKTLPAMEWGYSSSSYTIGAGETQEISVNFSSTKTEAPSVFVDTQANVDALILSSVKSVTTTSFTVLLKNESDTSVSNVTFDYLALSTR